MSETLAPETPPAPSGEAGILAGGFSFEQLEPSPPPPRDAAEQALMQAHAQAQALHECAREEGYAEGRAAGHRDGLEQATAAALALGQALGELQGMRAQLAEELERDAIELALALAAKLLAGALDAQPDRVVEVVRGALRRIADRRRIVVLVDPDDLEVVSGAIGELQAQAGGIELCEVQADRRVGRGGAIVRTAESEIDATVETQLVRARELMLSAGEPAYSANEGAFGASEPELSANEVAFGASEPAP